MTLTTALGHVSFGCRAFYAIVSIRFHQKRVPLFLKSSFLRLGRKTTSRLAGAGRWVGSDDSMKHVKHRHGIRDETIGRNDTTYEDRDETMLALNHRGQTYRLHRPLSEITGVRRCSVLDFLLVSMFAS
jgi:hypothetical protein